jgi:hypothetical protein
VRRRRRQARPAEAAKHYERALSGLVPRFVITNLFNRLNVATRQIARGN